MSGSVEVVFHAHLKGAEPFLSWGEDGEGWSAEWVEEIAAALARGEDEAVKKACLEHAEAVLLCGEVPLLLGDGDTIPAQHIDIAGVRVDSTDGTPVVRIHRWAAAFSVSVSLDIVRAWCDIDDRSGRAVFSNDRYEAWLDGNDIWGLQDAVRFYLWGVPYELDGMGDQSCTPDEASVAAALG